MRFSIWPTIHQPWTDLLAVAQHADATGWDGVWIADHFMPNAGHVLPESTPTLEAMALVSALSAVIPRARIGTAVLGNTYRHPAVLANMSATIDHISNGRFTLGLGAGWQENEHLAYGIPLEPIGTRIARLDEALAVIRGLLDRPRSSFDGRFYQLADAVCEPKPVQPRLPILVGASGPRMLRVVAKWADAWNTYGDPEHSRLVSAELDNACEEAGRDPREILRTAQTTLLLAGERASHDELARIEAQIRLARERAKRGPAMPAIGGTAEQLADALAAYDNAGIGELIIPDSSFGEGPERLDRMDRFINDVAADFQSPAELPSRGTMSL